MATILADEQASSAEPSGEAPAVPWHVYAALFASTAVVIGIMWDISWHRTIGRDTFWTPAHLLIYIGGIVAGLSCGFVVLKTTFRGSPAEKARAVSFWGFRGPFGAWIAIWGAIAMVTSAPFDDWWHSAYGLDVKILSPPHIVLALGIVAIQLGAMFMVLPLQNVTRGRARRRFQLYYMWTAGMLMLMASIMAIENTIWTLAHASLFYRSATIVFPLFLTAALASSRMKWPATTVAAVYTVVIIIMMQVLQLFPAEPRLGPIFVHVTHMVPPQFPLLIILPAFAMDLIAQRFAARELRNDWLLGLALGVAFFAIFLFVHWLMGEFMLTELADNRFFAARKYDYNLRPGTYWFRHMFWPRDKSGTEFQIHMFMAVLHSLITARLGLAWGRWMATVKR